MCDILPTPTPGQRENAMTIERHGNTWMLLRRNGEGIVSVVRSFRTERAARNALARLSALLS